jgi:nicotinamide-nucleotide amidase
MFEALVVPRLRECVGEEVLVTAEVCCFGLGESAIADRLGDLMHRDRQPSVGTTVGVCTCTCRIRARGSRNVVEPQLEQTIAAVASRLGPFAFSQSDLRTRTAPPTLAEVVGNMLRERNETVCTAESCTGGLIGGMLTEVAGSSAYYAGGWVTYSNAMKASQLGVLARLIEAHGAVSAPVAEAMALGAIDRSGATYAVSVTGIAGPGGGGPDKPVGTVFIGIGHRVGNAAPTVDVRRLVIPGSRAMVRERTVTAALQLLRFHLLGVAASAAGVSDSAGAEGTMIAWEVPIDRASTGSSSESQVTE